MIKGHNVCGGSLLLAKQQAFNKCSFPSFLLVITAPSQHPGTVLSLRHHTLLHIVATRLFYPPLRRGFIGRPYLYNTQNLADGDHKILVGLLKIFYRDNMALSEI